MKPRDPPLRPRSADPDRAVAVEVQTSSPRYSPSPKSTGAAHSCTSANRKIAIAVDLSDESAFAVQWAAQNYLRPGDAVTMLHVRPTSILYGADWGSTHFSEVTSVAAAASQESRNKEIEDDFDKLTAAKVTELAQPLVDARVPFKVHIVKDHDMKERVCLEIERLGFSAVIMGSIGFGASRRTSKTGLGSVSDYCLRHCVCPLVVVRFPEDRRDAGEESVGGLLYSVQEEQEYHAQDHEH